MKFYIQIIGVLIILLLLWTLYRYLSNDIDLSPIDRCSLKYDRDRIYEFDNLLTESECNQIIEIAKPKITKSPVLSKEKFHPGRTSSHIFLPSNIPLLQKIGQYCIRIFRNTY